VDVYLYNTHIERKQERGEKMAEETYTRRFGEVAMSKGFITKEQLASVMTTQVKGEIERSIHKLIGEILIDEGVMDQSQVKEVLDTMIKT
jgi:hypothetical protein